MQQDKRAIKAAQERWQRAAQTVIAATRRDLDMTQEQLAARIGWTRDRVAKLESGKTAPKFADVCVIARYGFNMPPEQLLQRILRWWRRGLALESNHWGVVSRGELVACGELPTWNNKGLTFPLAVNPHLILISIIWALTIGLAGGLLPAIRATRIPVAFAMRET